MTEPAIPPELTSLHVRTARALLAWSQKDLAKAAELDLSAVRDFEREIGTLPANTTQAIRAALGTAGIVFSADGSVTGSTVPPIFGANASGVPVRWVSAQDLAEWASRTDGPVSLPTLLTRLVQASAGPHVGLRFPSDEGVRHAGWDGVTDVAEGSTYVPIGQAGWEISAQSSKIPQKASEDYRKRTDDPAALDPASSAFIFVTPRHWPNKETWASERQAEGRWREVRVYDANDLVHWIEQHPAVGLWIARRLGKRPTAARELDEVWQEWSLATKVRLTEDLVLADRSEVSAALLRWLRKKPGILSLQGTTADEVVAFFHATLSELPACYAEAYRARTLVVTTAEAARQLCNVPSPLILLLTEPEPGLAQRLVQKGHFVLLAYDERTIRTDDVRILPRPSRQGIASALRDAGIPEPRAQSLARDSAGNLAVLRRLMPAAPGRSPAWAETMPPRALLAALLAGGWDESCEGDRARLAELAGQPYDTLISDLTPYLGAFDSPLQKVGSAWRMASPSDAWTLLAQYLTSVDLSRFETVAEAVMSASDPRFDMDPALRWMADVYNVRPEYSGLLRHGIGQVLILLALWGSRIHGVTNAAQRVDLIVERLLRQADAQRWWSLSGDFRLLAEASPTAFLDAIDDSLDQNDPPIKVLFDEDGEGPMRSGPLPGLMWALEALAWLPEYMLRVTHVLARLDAIDIKPRAVVNGPMNSLKAIHTIWCPQTRAPQALRMRALDLIRRHEPKAAWKLMLSILPRFHGCLTSTNVPRWRDALIDQKEVVTQNIIFDGAKNISQKLTRDVGSDPERWASLLDRLADLKPDTEAALEALDAAEPEILDAAGRAMLWQKLRRVLHHHYSHPDADWTLSKEVLQRLNAVYERFAPEDPIAQVAWLFDDSVVLPWPTGKSWREKRNEVERARQVAIISLYEEHGAESVLRVSHNTKNAIHIGRVLYDGGLPTDSQNALIETAARSRHGQERDVARGLIMSAFRDHGEAWAEALVARVQAGSWGDDALMAVMSALPCNRWTWDLITKIGGDLPHAYWRQVGGFLIDADGDDLAYAIEWMLQVDRPVDALQIFIENSQNECVPSTLIVRAMKDSIEKIEGNYDYESIRYLISRAMSWLDDRCDVERDILVELEWKYLTYLEDSERPPRVLTAMMSSQPKLFIEMVKLSFRPRQESGVKDPETSNPEKARRLAEQAYRLLDLWSDIPGGRSDGTIDGTILEAWIREARDLAKAVGREEIADTMIGQMLSAAPSGADGYWPAEAVRDVLDRFRSTRMSEGFYVGKRNRRGITTRMPDDGGSLERKEAAQYHEWAQGVELEHPFTARVLRMIADGYDREAIWMDEHAERSDWSQY
ncbi:multiprotein-bridging factor 1 family protein [Tistrella mobilis]|uniref:helix-turn-helix domain-containing protein n=1 Tax=Tistrella mobilis TaxID=171437 RepID=UPI003556B97E